jgi:hypothetical protein
MRFLRNRGIYQSDVGLCWRACAHYKLGPGYRLLTASGLPGDPVHGQDHPLPSSPAALRAQTELKDVQEEHAQAIIVLMSSGRLILDRVARQQSRRVGPGNCTPSLSQIRT